jgi:hypothetical protein
MKCNELTWNRLQTEMAIVVENVAAAFLRAQQPIQILLGECLGVLIAVDFDSDSDH